MTNKEHVMKYGGKFSITGGEKWHLSDGHDIHFALNPKMGCRNTNISVGFHEAGKEFAPHRHPISEEILIIHSGKGECFLYDKWIPCETGDIVFAPPGVLHGTRSYPDATEPFVTLGIASPAQLDLYMRAGYDVMEDNSGEYTGDDK